MNAFIVELDDKPGELARITEAISQKGINIESFAGATVAGKGAVVFLTNDEAGTRSALSGQGFRAREIELVNATMPHHPGTLAQVARKLADAGINIVAALPVGMEGGTPSVAFATSDPARAREAIGQATKSRVPA